MFQIIKYFLLVLCLNGCNNKKEFDFLTEVTSILDVVCDNNYKNYQITLIGHSIGSSYELKKLEHPGDFAVFRTIPKIKVEKNFLHGTIDIEFIDKFSKLNCVHLLCTDELVRVDIRTKVTIQQG